MRPPAPMPRPAQPSQTGPNRGLPCRTAPHRKWMKKWTRTRRPRLPCRAQPRLARPDRAQPHRAMPSQTSPGPARTRLDQPSQTEVQWRSVNSGGILRQPSVEVTARLVVRGGLALARRLVSLICHIRNRPGTQARLKAEMGAQNPGCCHKDACCNMGRNWPPAPALSCRPLPQR